MRITLLAIAMYAISATGNTVAGPGDVAEAVNVIVEPGTNVGPCAEGGTLSYPPAPYTGTAHLLLKADATLAARHEALTNRRPSWLRQLDGPSTDNRLFTAPNGDRAIVLRACKSRDCAANTAYGSYALRSSEYALEIRAPGEPKALGSASPTLAAAIACARAHDDRVRGRVLEEVKKQTGR
jgi:hypothetical protein